jgi:hypothetical protein
MADRTSGRTDLIAVGLVVRGKRLRRLVGRGPTSCPVSAIRFLHPTIGLSRETMSGPGS